MGIKPLEPTGLGCPAHRNHPAALLPDTVHHVRRLWTSLRLLTPSIDLDLDLVGLTLPASLQTWEEAEHPVVLACDGISHSEKEED
jgi:hypothetical protein